MKLNRLVHFGLIAIIVNFSTSRPTRAEDWPQWRGPNRDGVSKETGLLKEWPQGGPKLLWQVNNAGSGFSTPSVVGERIYLLGNEGMDNEFVQALAIKDGQRVWSTKVGKVGPNDPGQNYPGGRSTPTIDGEVLFVLGSDGDLVCAAVNDGKIRWQKNLRTDFGGQPGRWAYAESPLVDGDVLVCTPGGADATIVAVNKKNGEVIWKCAVAEGDQAAYASPIIAEIGGKKQYVQFLQNGLAGVDVKTGKLLWRWDKPAQGSPANIPSPLVYDGHIFAGSGRGGGVIKLMEKDGRFEVEQVFFDKKVPAGIGGGVRVGDYLFGSSGPSMLCLEFKTGKLKWEGRSLSAPAVCFAEGRIYLHGDNGEVALIEANSEAYRERGRFTPPNQPDRGRAKAWTYPVVANGRLYIRDVTSLWSYDIKEKSVAAR